MDWVDGDWGGFVVFFGIGSGGIRGWESDGRAVMKLFREDEAASRRRCWRLRAFHSDHWRRIAITYYQFLSYSAAAMLSDVVFSPVGF